MRTKVIDYLVLYLFIAQTSMPFFIGDEFLIAGTLLSMLAFVLRRKSFDKLIFQYSFIFFLIFTLQSFFFSVLEVNIILGYFTRIFYAYFTIKSIGRNIGRYYVNIIFFFTIISFLFYFPSILIGNSFNEILESFSIYIEPFQLHNPGRTHIIIYTFGEQYSEFESSFTSVLERNSGPFWEPGGFGVFLILAIMLELVQSNKLMTFKNKFFLLAAITTLSTGTFLVLFVLIIFYLIIYRDLKKLILLSLVFVAALFVYANTFFLSEKVNNQLAIKQTAALKYAPRTRFVSAQLDLIDFADRPLLGRGRFAQTRFDYKEDPSELILNHRNNGTTNLLVEFGLIGFMTFFIFMYRSFRKFCTENGFNKYFAYVMVLITMLLGFSQMIFIKPFFIGLSFLFLVTETKQIAK